MWTAPQVQLELLQRRWEAAPQHLQLFRAHCGGVAAWRGVSTRRGRAVMRGLSGAGVLLEGKEKGTEPS